MKKQLNFTIILLCGLFLSTLVTCASATSGSAAATGPNFTGLGGAGMRLGIVVPQSQRLSDNQAYFPSLVQGVLAANMRKYSAISVLDRVSLDRVITETLDPTYEDNLDIVRLGHVAQVGYMMTGNIIQTASGLTLQINVTDTTPNAKTIASFSGNFSAAQLDNHIAINRASLELLTQMGVELTRTARNELGRASPQQDINAQTEMARGIISDQRGQTVEAILHYLNASSLESTATEALNRMSMATTTIATGSLGNQIRNDIQQRNEWVKLINETRRFFANNNFYNLAELYFSSTLDLSSIDYQNETADLTFSVQIRLNILRALEITKIIKDIHNGLEATGKSRQWGISVSVDPLLYAYVFDFELLNESGRVISSALTPDAIILGYGGEPYDEFLLFTGSSSSWYSSDSLVKPLRKEERREGFSLTFEKSSPVFYKVGSLISVHHESRLRSYLGRDFSSWSRLSKWSREPSFTVKASDITDKMTIRLKNIMVYDFKQVDRKTNNYKRINQGINIISVINEIF